MSSSYSANQYDSAFRSQRLQNWGQTKRASGSSRPAAQRGHTAFIADDRGHLLPGLGKRGSAWPGFKGTWDLPARAAAHRVNPTARSEEGLRRLRAMGFTEEPEGPPEQEAAAPAPEPESRPGTGGEGPGGSKSAASRGSAQSRGDTQLSAGPADPALDQ